MAKKEKPAIGKLEIMGVQCEYNDTMTYRGIKFVILSTVGKKALQKGSSGYCKNLNKGNSYLPAEKKNFDNGKYSTITGNSTPPPASKKAFSALISACKAAVPTARPITGPTQGMTQAEASDRTVKGTSTLESCKAAQKGGLRRCDSIHATGRAGDCLTSIRMPGFPVKNSKDTIIGAFGTGGVMYAYFDYRDAATASSDVYRAWKFFADNAHKHNICGITNEWWHWQYYGPMDASDQDTTGSPVEEGVGDENPKTDPAAPPEEPYKDLSYEEIQAKIKALDGLQVVNPEDEAGKAPKASNESKVTKDNPEVLAVSKSQIKLDTLEVSKVKS